MTQVDTYRAVLGLYIFAGQTWSNLDTLSRLRTIGSFALVQGDTKKFATQP